MRRLQKEEQEEKKIAEYPLTEDAINRELEKLCRDINKSSTLACYCCFVDFKNKEIDIYYEETKCNNNKIIIPFVFKNTYENINYKIILKRVTWVNLVKKFAYY